MAGKLGLALSGGGFRASLFHIGALARLAELDLLRRVEVISTVSGGSILGAYYYLKLKQLLEGKRTDFPKPSREAYVKIVREIESEFLAAVQKNIRVRALWNPYKNARMFLSDDYSRSDRMAELYNENFYRPVWRKIQGQAAGDTIPLHDIKISPPGSKAGFAVAEYNARAEHKIPILVINATTLNTGHSWHFTSSWAGEPDARSYFVHGLDTNVSLEQLRFDGKDRNDKSKSRERLPDESNEKARSSKLGKLTLADAVAASACVPGIFAPMPIHDLYWNREGREIVVELIDGGVFDNQGIDALYMAQCTEMICSDASGQLEDERAPSSGIFPVISRSNDILMDRVRDDGFYNLYQSKRGAELIDEHDPRYSGNELERDLRREWNVAKFAFFHLRQSFAAQPGYPAFPGPADRAPPGAGHLYRLSNIRTDLDCFCDVEAFSLMYDGYCLSNERMKVSGISGDGVLPRRGPDPQDTARLGRLLKHFEVGKELLFKVFRLPDPTAVAVALTIAAILAALTWWFWGRPLPSIPAMSFSVGQVATTLAAAALLALLKSLESTAWMAKLLDKLRWVRRGHWLAPITLVLGVALIVVWAVVTIQLFVFDRLYLRAGKIK
jgi:NTE family protein